MLGSYLYRYRGPTTLSTINSVARAETTNAMSNSAAQRSRSSTQSQAVTQLLANSDSGKGERYCKTTYRTAGRTGGQADKRGIGVGKSERISVLQHTTHCVRSVPSGAYKHPPNTEFSTDSQLLSVVAY